MERVTVAWCRFCQHYTPANEIGQGCPAIECDRTLIRRVGYVCPNEWCTRFYRTQREVKACDCGDSVA